MQDAEGGKTAFVWGMGVEYSAFNFRCIREETETNPSWGCGFCIEIPASTSSSRAGPVNFTASYVGAACLEARVQVSLPLQHFHCRLGAICHASCNFSDRTSDWLCLLHNRKVLLNGATARFHFYPRQEGRGSVCWLVIL